MCIACYLYHIVATLETTPIINLYHNDVQNIMKILTKTRSRQKYNVCGDDKFFCILFHTLHATIMAATIAPPTVMATTCHMGRAGKRKLV